MGQNEPKSPNHDILSNSEALSQCNPIRMLNNPGIYVEHNFYRHIYHLKGLNESKGAKTGSKMELNGPKTPNNNILSNKGALDDFNSIRMLRQSIY